jgi:beta-barrel assembly-enhancing protease
MKRTGFLSALIATVGVTELTHVAAALAVDEAVIGREAFAQLRDDGQILFDSRYYEHLNEIGSVIAATVAHRYEYPIRFYIVKGDTANAFSVPGGYIYVNEPLLDLAKNRDEVAGVLGHETGHMVLHHVAKRMANSQRMGTLATIGSIFAQIAGGPLGGAAANYAMDNLYAGQDANLSRHIEAQADEEGARIVAATKTYNPYGLLWFFQTMTATYGPGQADWLRSHPLDAQRVADLQRLFVTDTATFAAFTDTHARDVAYW